MKLDFKEHWNLYLAVFAVTAMFCLEIYTEIHFHYFLEFKGRVIGKEMIPPKKMAELNVYGTDETFPVWKWNGIEFDSVRIGDSIVKRRFEPQAFWYRKNQNGTYQLITLTYWTD